MIQVFGRDDDERASAPRARLAHHLVRAFELEWLPFRRVDEAPRAVELRRALDVVKLKNRKSPKPSRVGLAQKAHSRTIELSGGQQQRVAVARMLVQRPDLVLADEPFAAVDRVTTERVFEALLELNREEATLLVNLHDVEIARRFPRIVALHKGRVAFDGPPERLSEEALNEIYAGEDPRRGPPPEPQEGGRGKPFISVAEGRDGVASH